MGVRLFDFDLQSLLRWGQRLSLQTFFKNPCSKTVRVLKYLLYYVFSSIHLKLINHLGT